MKKLLAIMAVSLILSVSAGSAYAATLTFGVEELMQWDQLYAWDTATMAAGHPADLGDAVRFKIAAGDQPVEQWYAANIGRNFWGTDNGLVGGTVVNDPLPSKYYDLTGYDRIALEFKNPSTGSDWINTQLFINTGWTDLGETDERFESDWTWILPGDSYTAVLDLAGIPNLNHVSAIGLQLGSNYVHGGADYAFNHNGLMPLVVNPVVPEPATMSLGLLSIVGFAIKKRFF